MKAIRILWSAIILMLLACLGSAADENRESWQPPKVILDAAGVTTGMTIGEAGAGRGYLTFHLAERVGPDGIVFANDIDKEGLEEIRSRARRDGFTNIVTVKGEVTDPLFPEHQLDMVVMVYVLHCLERPVEFMTRLKTYVKPGGSVVIVERNSHHDRGHYPAFMSKKQILETISESGYRLESTVASLPRDTIYIYRIEG